MLFELHRKGGRGTWIKLAKFNCWQEIGEVRWTPLSETGQKSDSMFATIIHTALFYIYWSLLYSAILRSWADSLHSHVILHEWTAFYSAFLNIHWSDVPTALAWLVPQESAARESQSRRVLCTPYNHAPYHFMQSHICKVYACLAVTCHLHFWQNDGGSFTCYCSNTGGGTDTKIRVSTESWPWRRKFSRCSSRDSNPRHFNHESGALTTVLFTLFRTEFFQYPDAFKNWDGGVYLKRMHNKITKPICYHYCFYTTMRRAA